MHFIEKIGVASVPLGILSIFIFPWAVTMVLMAMAAVAFPPSALFLGILADIFYYPGTGLPVGITWGAMVMVIGWGVRHVLKTRILR